MDFFINDKFEIIYINKSNNIIEKKLKINTPFLEKKINQKEYELINEIDLFYKKLFKKN